MIISNEKFQMISYGRLSAEYSLKMFYTILQNFIDGILKQNQSKYEIQYQLTFTSINSLKSRAGFPTDADTDSGFDWEKTPKNERLKPRPTRWVKLVKVRVIVYAPEKIDDSDFKEPSS